jgi:hypothetical protein
MSVAGPLLPENCTPSGLRPSRKRFTKVSLTTAAFGPAAESLSVNSRPEISGMPILPKNPGPTSLKRELLSPLVSLAPAMVTSVPQLFPAISGTSAAATPLAPGMAAISDSIRSNRACVCSCWYPFSAGDTENPITFSVFIPRSTCIRFTRLFKNSPVGISSTADTMTCAHTSALRTRTDAAVPELWPDSFFKVAADELRAASHAGYSPNSRPVSTERPSPNSSTGHSNCACT